MQTYTKIEVKTCPVCGKTFVPAPFHAYRIGNAYSAPVCSYTCARAAEKARGVVRRGPKPKGGKKA